MIIIWIIVSIIIFSFIVFIHELGHFSTARFFWVKVEEFWIGIPPRAKKLFRDKKWTLYSLNWLPIGGFVKLTGESPNTFLTYDKNGNLHNNKSLQKAIESQQDIFDKQGEKIGELIKAQILEKIKENSADYNLMNKPAWQQAIIILAWVFMNFLLAAIIFSFLFWFWVKPVGINSKIETDLNLKLIPTYEQALDQGVLIKNPGILLSPIENSIAENAGIQKWDIVLKANNTEIQSTTQLQEIIQKSKDSLVILEILREDETQLISITPSAEGKIGTYLGENIQINNDFIHQYSLWKSIQYGFSETYNQSLLTLKGLGLLLGKIFNPETPQERQEAVSQVSGPIGIVDFITSSVGAWIMFLLIITAIISINLWIFNLLPIPALDGGRFIFITINSIIQKIFWKKAISEHLENYIHVSFFIVLIALSVLIAYNDIIKIIS